MLRRLLLIGDVHTEATRLAHVLAHAERTRPDAVLCVGDIVDGPEDATRCIELLRDHDVVTVRGNHERWPLAGTSAEPWDGPDWALAWLGALRDRDPVVDPGGVHSDGRIALAAIPRERGPRY